MPTLGPNGWQVDTPQVQRLRVDEEQIGFWAGKFFRSYLELNVPVAGPFVSARFTSPIDFILWAQTLDLSQGALRCEIFVGNVVPIVPAGVWSQVPLIGVNRMLNGRPQPYYTPQVTIETGGSFTGGTAVDLMTLRAAGQNGQASNVGESSTERGLPPGVYYIRLSTITGGLAVNDPAQGVYSIVWEERP